MTERATGFAQRGADAAAELDRMEKELRMMAGPGQADAIAKRVPREQVIGVRMRHIFALAKANTHLDLDTVRELLRSHWYEMRMVAVSILDARARKAKPNSAERTALFDLYLSEHDHIDTWDLVDRAAPRVVGEYLLDRPKGPIHELSRSGNHWERRSAIVACFWIIRHGSLDTPLVVLTSLVDDPEPFVQTALGTALREVRRVDPTAAEKFSAEHRTLHPAARRAMKVGRA